MTLLTSTVSNNFTYIMTSNITSLSENGANKTGDDPLAELNALYASTLLPFTVILGLFGVIGVVGNVLVFCVYGCERKFKDKKLRYYVLTLATIDFITCLTLIPGEMIKHVSYFNFTERVLCKMKCFFNVFGASSASYCLTLIAVDRFIMICHPLYFAKVPAFSNGVAWRLCLGTIALAIATSLPSAILCGITTHTMLDVNGHTITVYMCESDPYYERTISRYVYRFALCLLQTFISILVIILYAKIGHAVMKVLKIRDEKSLKAETMTLQEFHNHYSGRGDNFRAHQDSHHHHMPTNIKLLFLVTLIFIITYLFYMALSWVDQTQLTPTQFLFFSMAFRMYFIHSIINPILYMKMDRYFRKRCIKIVRTVFRIRK